MLIEVGPNLAGTLNTIAICITFVLVVYVSSFFLQALVGDDGKTR